MSSASRDLVNAVEHQGDEALLRHLAWPIDQLADGLAELGRRAGLSPSAIDPRLIPGHIDHRAPGEMDRYMRWLADDARHGGRCRGSARRRRRCHAG